MFFPEDHGRVAPEDLCDILGVVLARDGEDNTAGVEGQERPLKIYKGIAGIIRSERDAARTEFAYDTAPERVIEVEYDALFRPAACGTKISNPFFRDRCHEFIGKWDIECIYPPQIERVICSDAVYKAVSVKYDYVWEAFRELLDPLIIFFYQIKKRILSKKVPVCALVGDDEAVYDHGTADGARVSFDVGKDIAKMFLFVKLRILKWIDVKENECDVRIARVYFAAVILEIKIILLVRCAVDIGVDVVLHADARENVPEDAVGEIRYYIYFDR